MSRRHLPPAEPVTVQADVDQAARIRYRTRRASAARQAAAQIAARDGNAAALWVRDYIAENGHGPLWKELAVGMNWPERPWGLRDMAIRGLQRRGWLEFGTEPHSLRPGPAFHDAAGDHRG